MKLKLDKPLVVKQAACAKRGWNFAIEILIGMAVFIVASIGISIIQIPAIFAALFMNETYVRGIQEGNIELATLAYADVVSSESMIILMLFTDAVMILIVWGFCRLFEKRKMQTLGFVKKGFVREYGIGLAVGLAVFSAAVLLAVLTGAIDITGVAVSSGREIGILVLFALGYMIQGMAEEVLCRGYLMVSAARRSPMWVAVLINSLFFAVLHLGNTGITPLAFINLFLFGVFASLYFIRRGNIWGSGAFHSVWNFAQGCIYGIQVSGMTKTTTIFGSSLTEGKEFLNGGAFGMEGGICVTVVLAAGIIVLYLMKQKEEHMCKRPVKMVLFDLDGTLLPMDQEAFTGSYFQMLANKLSPLGYEQKPLFDGIWKGVGAMVLNDGSCTNEERFWKTFAGIFGERVYEDIPVFEEFYQNEFNQAASVCGKNPLSSKSVKQIKELGLRVALATNPIFPAVATENRIRWAGLCPKDFEFISTYESSRYCKPNPEYYSEILTQLNIAAEDCLMVGNDVSEDMIAKELGMRVFLLTDCLINKENVDIDQYPHGGFKELMQYVGQII